MFTFIQLQLIAAFPATAHAKNCMRQSLILTGDAGETVNQQNSAISNAANYMITGVKTILSLGNNMYPQGMDLPGERDTVHM